MSLIIMKITLLFLLLILSIGSAKAMSVPEAFKNFYNNKKISSNHCGKNIHYFLEYLKENDVLYNSGLVVSIHEPYLHLNHFNARWGNSERYQNGQRYNRSNWYFHVFAVFDGVAIDFSQNSQKAYPLREYLERSYYPSSVTRNIMMQGELTKEKLQEKYLNLEMNIYKSGDYLKSPSPVLYSGSFAELFKFAENEPLISDGFHNNNLVSFKSSKINNDKSVSFSGLSAIGEAGELPLRADSVSICRALGYFGSLKSQMQYTVSDKRKMYELFSTVRSESWSDIRSSQTRVSLSKQLRLTAGYNPRQPLLHFAKQITCSDLNSVIGNR